MVAPSSTANLAGRSALGTFPSAPALNVDARSMQALKTQAGADPKSAIREAAKQFESLFMQQLTKSMRDSTLASGLLDNAGTKMGTEMLDSQLSTQLSGIPVTLINDLQATALGLLVLPETAFAVLQAGAAPADGTIAVLAPGTGLGVALLVSVDGTYRALPSEGGHADFAPGSDDEIALWRYLRGLYGAHVSYERVLSGAGIGDLYDFVRQTTGATEPAWPTGDRNAAISHAALDGRDPTAVRALEMFVEILGGEAGNHALRGLATGGVVLGGGIPPKILPALQHPRFLDRLTAKGRFAAWTRTLSVRVALEPRAALFGAAHHAVTHKDARP